MASFWTNKAKAVLAAGDLHWDTDTIKCILVTSANDADADDDFVGSITTLGELSGTGYTAGHGGAGRQDLDSKSITQNNTNDRAELKAADEVWSSIQAGTVAAVLIHKAGTSDDTDALLIAKLDLSEAKITNGENLTIQFTGGIVLRID